MLPLGGKWSIRTWGMSREYWMIYRGPGILAVLWFGSSATPSPFSRQQVVSLSHSSFFFSLSPVELTIFRRRKGRVGKIPIIRPRESLVFCKSFNTLCGCPPSVASYLFGWIPGLDLKKCDLDYIVYTVVLETRARIFKLLRSPRIDSNEPIPPGCVAWRPGTTTLFLLGS